MGMLSRLRETGETFVARQLQARAVSFSARIPGAAGPLLEWRLEVRSTFNLTAMLANVVEPT